MVKGYSTTQIALHWAIAAFIFFQLIFGESMADLYEEFEDGAVAAVTLAGWAHILVGITILALVVWRLALRLTRGAPAAPAGEKPALALAATVGHWVLYALMVGVPITGMMAWFGGIEAAGEVHELAKPAFIILIVGHVGAAFYHHFYLNDGLLNRMRKAQD